MAQELQLRRGTSAMLDNSVGAFSEVQVDVDTKELRVFDGETLGGFALARKPFNAVSYLLASGESWKPGEVIYSGDFRFEAKASTDTDYDFVNAAQQRLKVLPLGGVLYLDSFGADPDGVLPSTLAFRQFLKANARRGGGHAKAGGFYRLGDPGDPVIDDAPACYSYDVPKSGRDSYFDFRGANFLFTEGTGKWALRIYQLGNNAGWKTPIIDGGFFHAADSLIDPLGCILWDDIGGGNTKGLRFYRWRHSGLKSAVCLFQRNCTSWSENNTHEDMKALDCDRLYDNGARPDSTATASQARTNMDLIFGSTAKSYLIVNRMGMYDSQITRVKGNGQKIAVFRNNGGGIYGSRIKDIDFEQGYEGKTTTSGIMTAGSNVLTLDGETQFGEWMAEGQPVDIAGAGTGGATLKTWITGFTSSSEVTVSHNASESVVGATVTTLPTVCYEEAGPTHQFKTEELSHRNNGRQFDDRKFTGLDRSRRPMTFGALQASGDIETTQGALKGPRLAVGAKVESAATVTLDATDSSVWTTVRDADGNPVQVNRSRVYVQLILSTVISARYRSGSLNDFGTFGGGLIDELRDTDTYTQPLEVRTTGGVLQVHSAADLAAWRGRTLKVHMERYL
ncbi:hypothetical protein [Salipiger marinus]|uniref:Major tropism determinant N-terminal domain-containing protein n=1 Tax=Salipiger marinus TaxID=555512 RepID=A0A1G8LLU2_9RHOB|nr:hypothetical protein [Salipiger marinus]SDI56190.1 hypothetical protein SAMN04487993_1006218 [Salipiger marinus]